MFRKYPELFIDPKENYPIHDLDRPFSDYIEKCKTFIAKTRLDLSKNADEIIEANSPFELVPAKKPRYGALLLHGLFDSPFIVRDIGESLRAHGGLVRSILLPGHGTVPGGLLSVTYEDWLQALRYGIATLEKEVEKIILVGFSTGATLALYHALKNETSLAALVFAAPALKIKSHFDFALNWHRVISWAWPRAKWISIREENNYTTYKSCAFNGAYQLYRLINEIKQLDEKNSLPCPLFCALSEDDVTVSSAATMNYFQKKTNPKNRLILYSNRSPSFDDARITVRRAAYPEFHIDNLSHLAIPISPSNTYLGKNGTFINASREKESDVVYTESLQEAVDFNNWLYQLKIRKTRYLRSTFNPDFEFMMQSIWTFLDEILR